MKPFNANDCDLNGINIIEAGAGTGKTYNIQLLVLRVLLEKDIPIRNILVVTFTIFATEELIDRLHAILLLAARAVELCAADPAALDRKEFDQIRTVIRRSYLDAGAEGRKKVRRQILNALRDFDQAAVMTIHGFCQKMLLENAFASRLRYGVELRPDISDIEIRIAADYIRKFNTSGVDAPLLSSLFPSGFQPEDLLASLRTAIGNDGNARIVWNGSEPDSADFSFEHLGDVASELTDRLWDPALWSPSACPLYELASARKAGNVFLMKYEKSSFPDLATILQAMTAQPDRDPEDLRRLFYLAVQLIREKMPVYAYKKDLELIFQPAYDDFYRLMAECGELLDSVGGAFVFFYQKQMRKYKAEMGFMTFSDLILRMWRIVSDVENGAAFRAAVRQSYPYIFVDEFQDTDPMQFKIFHTIFSETQPGEPENRGFFMIGDPKQAIYSFRGGDIYSYLDARKQVPDSRRFTLNTNFRSGRDYLAAVQAFYKKLGNDPFGIKEIQLAPIVWGGKEKRFLLRNGRPCTPLLEFPVSDTADKIAGVTVGRVRELLTEGRYTLADDKGGSKPVTADDIAILFPTKRHGMMIEKQLNDAGIDTIWMSDSDLYQKPEAKALHQLMDMIYSDAPMSKMMAVLGGDIFQCTAGELSRLGSGSTEQDADGGSMERNGCELAQEYFVHLREVWEKKGFYVMFRALMFTPNSDGRSWLSAVRENIPGRFEENGTLAMNLMHINCKSGRYVLGRLRQLGESLHQAEQKRHLTPGRLLIYLRGRIAQDKDLIDSSETMTIQRSTDAPAVRMLTLHASKGLEFPIVIIPSFISQGSAPGMEPRLAHERTERIIDMSGWLSRNRRQDLKEACEKEQELEKWRLLYVGLTRAKFFCCLPYSFNSQSATPLSTRITEIDPPVQPELEPPGPLRSDEPDELPGDARDFTGNPTYDWQIASFSRFAAGAGHISGERDASSVYGGTDELDSDAAEKQNAGSAETGLPGDDELEALFEFASGAQMGTIWHELFEKMDFAPPELGADPFFDPESDAALTAKLRESGLYRAIRRCRDDAEEAPKRDLAFARMLKGILCNPMGELSVPDGDRFCLREITPEHRASELKFLYVLGRGVTLRQIKDCLERYSIRTGSWAEGAESAYLDWGMLGFIDLLCQSPGGKYYIVDWKSNCLNGLTESFRRSGLQTEVTVKLYTLQYLLYTVAFWHFLKERQGIELTEANYRKYFGGVLYLFVRGIAAPLKTMTEAERKVCEARGIYYDLPPYGLIAELKELLEIRAAGPQGSEVEK